MPSPSARCKQSVVLLVVSLFLWGCVVPSSVGSTVDIVDIRRQSEENNDPSKHSTARKKKRKKPGWAMHPCSCPCQGCCRLQCAAACCMQRHASKPPPTGPKNRCCSRLRHAVACFNRWCLVAAQRTKVLQVVVAALANQHGWENGQPLRTCCLLDCVHRRKAARTMFSHCTVHPKKS